MSVILRTDRLTNDRPLFLEEPSWKNFKWPYLHNGARWTHCHYGPPIGSQPQESNGHVTDDVICGVKKN